MDRQQKHGLALVGAGAQGENHLLALDLLGPEGIVELRAVVDLDPERADALASRWSVPAYATLNAMLAAQEGAVQGAIVAVPNRLHARVAIEALDAGLHVLAEKPMSTSSADSGQMIAAADRADRVLKVGYPWPDRLEWARFVLDSIGPVRFVQLIFSCQDGIPSSPHYWDSLSGGVIPDLAGHPLAGLSSLIPFGHMAVTASGSRDRGIERYGERFVAEDSAQARIHCAGGLEIELQISWADGTSPAKKLGMCLYGTDGELHVRLHDEGDTIGYEPLVRIYGERTVLGPPPPTYQEGLALQVQNWAGAWDGGRLTLTPEQALDAELVVDAIVRSARGAGTVRTG